MIGAGTNHMNVHIVAKVSQGLANYLKKPGHNYSNSQDQAVAISYDSRVKSEDFAKTAAGLLAANGIHVYIYSQLMPTPCLSYAVRALQCSAGVMNTASHNPAKYNGYKVYGADGCQITDAAANSILAEIEKLDIFDDIRTEPFEAGLVAGLVEWIPESAYDSYMDEVKKQSLAGDHAVDKGLSIVYTPLNGTGLVPVMRALKESGFSNVTVVNEQEKPDGTFPTCPYPNPEIKETMALGIQYAKRYDADLLLATDPDCDRVGIAVKDKDGEYVLLSGNETGVLLLDYICSRRIALNTMPPDPIMVKTIVTTDMAEQVAKHYGVRTINVLTGFEYIGEQIGRLEADGKADSYLFGFEESYGYLSGTYVRDKDGVNGVLLICEMFAYYQAKGISLLDKLEELYQQYGYCLNTLHSYSFEGSTGFKKMQKIMQKFRQPISTFGNLEVTNILDYLQGIDSLPKSDVLKFLLENHCSLVVRPSGTEPKLKLYISASAKNHEDAMKIADDIVHFAEKQYDLL